MKFHKDCAQLLTEIALGSEDSKDHVINILGADKERLYKAISEHVIEHNNKVHELIIEQQNLSETEYIVALLSVIVNCSAIVMAREIQDKLNADDLK